MSPLSPVGGRGLGFNCPGNASLSGKLIFVDLHFALEAWRDVCPSLALTSGCMGRNVAWGWQGWQGLQGCHPSWPERDCGFEYADGLGALRQVPWLAADRVAEGRSKLAPSPWLSMASFSRTAQQGRRE